MPRPLRPESQGGRERGLRARQLARPRRAGRPQQRRLPKPPRQLRQPGRAVPLASVLCIWLVLVCQRHATTCHSAPLRAALVCWGLRGGSIRLGDRRRARCNNARGGPCGSSRDGGGGITVLEIPGVATLCLVCLRSAWRWRWSCTSSRSRGSSTP